MKIQTNKIVTKAKVHGVFNSPDDGSIIYVDPDHEDKQHRNPVLSKAEARVAFERGMIEDPDGAEDASDDDAEEQDRDPNLVGTKAAERTEQFAEQDHEAGQGSGTLDSRSATAWQDRGRVEGGAEGYTDGVRTSDAGDTPPAPEIDDDSGDDDAPPARRKPGPKPKAASQA